MLSALAASSLLAGAAGVEADTPNENAGLSSVFFPSSDDFGGTSAVLVVRLNALGAGTLVSFFCSPLSSSPLSSKAESSLSTLFLSLALSASSFLTSVMLCCLVLGVLASFTTAAAS